MKIREDFPPPNPAPLVSGGGSANCGVSLCTGLMQGDRALSRPSAATSVQRGLEGRGPFSPCPPGLHSSVNLSSGSCSRWGQNFVFFFCSFFLLKIIKMWLASVEDGPIQKKREKFLVLGCPASSLGKDQEVKDQGQTYLPPPGPVEPARPPLGGAATTGRAL